MLREWLPIYLKIANVMEYSVCKDQLSTFLLSFLLKMKEGDLKDLKEICFGKDALICGAGPSLERDLSLLKDNELLRDFVKISADGATSALLELGHISDVIVTDLDGNLSDILQATSKGALPVIHAHSDNIPLLRTYLPKFERALGTTQVLPTCNVYNFGGFTDGDRCVFLADAMGTRSIILVGMDFGKEIGKYSKKEKVNYQSKRKKLKIGKKLLEWHSSKSNSHLYNFTSQGETIVGFEDITLEEIHKLRHKSI